MALPTPPVYISAEEYLRVEREADFKSEYVDGRIYAMSGGSPAHQTIAFNLTGELYSQLRDAPCRGFTSDAKVRTPTDNLYTYPDLTVVCGEPVYADAKGDVLDNPVLIVEILSPTTEAFDRGRKFARYQEIVTLTDYVLIAQNEPRVEHFVRQPDGSWNLRPYTGLEASVSITSINCSLLLARIYDRVEFASLTGLRLE
ncbi:MAG: Uma2 family endonuclease [Pyrinomonadaceae bacterium]